MSWEKIITQGIAADASVFGALLKDAQGNAVTLPTSGTSGDLALSLTWDTNTSKPEWKTVDLSGVDTGTVTSVTDGTYTTATDTNGDGTSFAIDITAASIDIAATSITGAYSTGQVLGNDGNGNFEWTDPGTGLSNGNNSSDLLGWNGSAWGPVAQSSVIGGLQASDDTLTALSGLSASSVGDKKLIGIEENNGSEVGFAIDLDADVASFLAANDKAAAKTVLELENVDNESKTTMFSSPAFTGTPTGITAAHVGLGNVDNESKLTMFDNPTFTNGATIDSNPIATQTWTNGQLTGFQDAAEVGALIDAGTGVDGNQFAINKDSTAGAVKAVFEAQADRVALTDGTTNKIDLEVKDLYLAGNGGVVYNGTAVVGPTYVSTNNDVSFVDYASLNGDKGVLKFMRDKDESALVNGGAVINPVLQWHDTSDQLTSGTGAAGYWSATVAYNDGSGTTAEAEFEMPLAMKIDATAMANGSFDKPSDVTGFDGVMNGAQVGTMFVGDDNSLWIKTSMS